MAPEGTKVVARNRKARHDFAILDTVEAGMVLVGSEVKSLRARARCSWPTPSPASAGGELWMEGVRIAPYAFATGVGAHDPDRPRKLLLHREQLDKLGARIAQEQLTLVPLAIYFKDGRAKVELALARGRRKGDQRQAMAERDADREVARALGRQRKGMTD